MDNGKYKGKAIIEINKQEDLEMINYIEMDLLLPDTRYIKKHCCDEQWYKSINPIATKQQDISEFGEIEPVNRASVKVKFISVNVVQKKR